MPTNLGVYPYSPSTPVGLVRLLLGDTDPKQVEQGATGEYVWYSDAELEALVGIYGTPKATAIATLRMIAVSQAMLLRKWSSSQLSVDGPALAKTLLDAADALEKSSGAADAALAADAFKIVPTGGHYPRELYDEERYLYDHETRGFPADWIA